MTTKNSQKAISPFMSKAIRKFKCPQDCINLGWEKEDDLAAAEQDVHYIRGFQQAVHFIHEYFKDMTEREYIEMQKHLTKMREGAKRGRRLTTVAAWLLYELRPELFEKTDSDTKGS